MAVDPNGIDQGLVVIADRSRRRRRMLLAAGIVGTPVLIFLLWWFQPQALLFDNVVDEGFPTAPAAGMPAESEPEDDADQTQSPGEDDASAEHVQPAPSGPAELATGSFVSRNRYTVTGTATTYRLDDGQRVLRLEDFESTNGPDLYVYLTVASSADDDAALDAKFVNLGVLAGNIGSQNYVIPDDVDLDLYTSVAIWCRRFTSSFGVADLST